MTYEDVKNLKDGDFKRLCGVTKETFAAMCEVVARYKQLSGLGLLGLANSNIAGDCAAEKQ